MRVPSRSPFALWWQFLALERCFLSLCPPSVLLISCLFSSMLRVKTYCPSSGKSALTSCRGFRCKCLPTHLYIMWTFTHGNSVTLTKLIKFKEQREREEKVQILEISSSFTTLLILLRNTCATALLAKPLLAWLLLGKQICLHAKEGGKDS